MQIFLSEEVQLGRLLEMVFKIIVVNSLYFTRDSVHINYVVYSRKK